MGVAKVILNGSTLIDITSDTVASSNLLSGYTATGKDGEAVSGAYVPPAISLQTKTGITPTESSQTIQPDSGYDGLASVQIDAVSSTYVGSGVTRKAAQTITPGNTTQTIASDQYLTGAQTILGDANLIAGNIVNGVTIFGVTGTASGGPDLSNDTVTAGSMLSGVTAHNSSGTQITGTITTKSNSGNTTLNSSTTTKSYAAGYYPNAHGATVTVYDGSVS